MNNTQRIEAARAALARAAWVRGDVPCYGDEALIDLLADLRHFCTVTSIDFDACDRLAAMHFAEEIGGAS
jgi:hypothetical protein